MLIFTKHEGKGKSCSLCCWGNAQFMWKLLKLYLLERLKGTLGKKKKVCLNNSNNLKSFNVLDFSCIQHISRKVAEPFQLRLPSGHVSSSAQDPLWLVLVQPAGFCHCMPPKHETVPRRHFSECSLQGYFHCGSLSLPSPAGQMLLPELLPF